MTRVKSQVPLARIVRPRLSRTSLMGQGMQGTGTASRAADTHATLARVLTFWPLVFYGLGVIVGAGIYVALGSVIARAGAFAPLSFLLAGLCAGLTGLCYAELAGRLPKASGAVAYVSAGFRSRSFGLVIGLATILAISVASAAIAHGAAKFLSHLVELPQTLAAAALVVVFTFLAMTGARTSVGFAALVGVLEVGGLVVAAVTGLMSPEALRAPDLIPATYAAWQGLLSGAFIAFFAFIGFETLANMAEDTKDAGRTVPLAILAAVAVSLLLYGGVSWAAVLAGRSADNPLVSIFSGAGARIFAALGFLSVANGVLVETLMLSRLLYGMADNGQLPSALARVDPRRRTPVLATFAAGLIILLATIALPFERLLTLANAITLGIFLSVDLALLLIKAREAAPAGLFVAPAWAPAAAAILSAALLAAELFL